MRHTEIVIAREAARFVRKDREKIPLTLGLYALSLKDRSLGAVARASYFLLRHLDDILDEERPVDEDPVKYAQDLQEQIETGDYDPSNPIAQLPKFAIPILESKASTDDNPRHDFVKAIDALIFDYWRRQERRPLSETELDNYYHEVLDPGLNLMLIGFDSAMRVRDIPGYSPSLGRLYSIRDLRKDWRLGIVNIPQRVLKYFGLNSNSPFDEVVSNIGVRPWIRREVELGTRGLIGIQRGLASLDESLTKKVLTGFANSAIKSASKRELELFQ